MLLSISTAGYVNEGIYDELMKRSTRFLLGDSKESHLLPVLYMIDDLDKWNDINELRKSNPNLGVSVSVDYLLEEINIAESSLSKKAEFLTKYCNIKQNSSQAWIDTRTVDLCRGGHLRLEDFRGCYCVGGIDLSQAVDLTACCALIEREGRIHVFGQFFLPAAKIEEATARDGLPYAAYITRGLLTPSGENYVDYQDCYRWFTRLIEEYEIYPVWVGYDRYSAQPLVQQMEAYGFHMDSVNQGENLTGIINTTEGLLKDGIIDIGDNDLMAVHFLDAALKVNAETNRKRLIKMNATAHIDGMAALLDAVCMRQVHFEEIGEQLKNA
jgi:phage terminase large subunit-like protein